MSPVRPAVVLLTVVVCCACDRSPTAPSQPRAAALARVGPTTAPQAPTGLMPCAPLPHLSVRQVIGPLGGTIPIGPHVLVIPPGALSKVQVIGAEIEAVKTRLVKPPTGRGIRPGFEVVNAIRFKPPLAFQTPVSLTLSYANCDVEPGESPLPTVVSTDSAKDVIHEIELSSVDARAKQVTAWLDHSGESIDPVCDYAIAW